MNIVHFISKRFNRTANMPRSIRMMRAVSGAGIAIAVISLVIALSIGKGFEKVYKRSLLDFNAHVVIMGTGEIEDPAKAYEELEKLRPESTEQRHLMRKWGWLYGPLLWLRSDTIERTSLARLVPSGLKHRAERLFSAFEHSVVSMNSFLYREALIIGKGGISGVVIKGVELGKDGSVGGMRIQLFDNSENSVKGFVRGSDGSIPVIMGVSLAKRMGIHGKPKAIRMLIPVQEEGVAVSQQFKEVEVVGTFEAGMHDYDDQFLLMNLSDVRRLFSIGKKTVTGIELRIDDPDKAPVIAEAAERILGPRYRAITWQELNSDLLAAVKLEKLVTALIMGIMLVVATLNIVAALVLTTLHRMSEISMLKALGLTDRRVERIFVRCGMSVGVKGIAAGLIAGLLIAFIVKNLRIIPLEAEIYLVNALPIDISWLICGIITLFCIAVLFVTSKIAARRLARVSPAEGLAQSR